MKKALPIIIVVIVLALLIWFVFKKVLPKYEAAKKQKQSDKKEASLTNYEAAATIDFVQHIPKF